MIERLVSVEKKALWEERQLGGAVKIQILLICIAVVMKHTSSIYILNLLNLIIKENKQYNMF